MTRTAPEEEPRHGSVEWPGAGERFEASALTSAPSDVLILPIAGELDCEKGLETST